MTIHRTITISFTPESYGEGVAAVFASLQGWCFRLNNATDIVVRQVLDEGIFVRTVPIDWDDETPQREFLVEWDDVDSLLYH